MKKPIPFEVMTREAWEQSEGLYLVGWMPGGLLAVVIPQVIDKVNTEQEAEQNEPVPTVEF